MTKYVFEFQLDEDLDEHRINEVQDELEAALTALDLNPVMMALEEAPRS
jgi:hypothetical protein